MTLLHWVWTQDADGAVAPSTIYYVLRVVMFILSFVLEDWAIHELVHSPRHRRQAVILVASSYVTWTYQTHTFSNSIETLLVLWSLVLIERITSEKVSEACLRYGAKLIHGVEPLLHHIESYLRVFDCLWNIQSHHLSSFHLDTRLATAATFFA